MKGCGIASTEEGTVNRTSGLASAEGMKEKQAAVCNMMPKGHEQGQQTARTYLANKTYGIGRPGTGIRTAEESTACSIQMADATGYKAEGS